CLQYYSSPFTF
nr:immunoglobulin light chain junction region [Macaca mulatta]MOX24050.1 immunoglobulin light chain junction region [Macaca mulatta]